MLAFLATDAAIAPGLLQRTLADVSGRTFNTITVDGDSSTNDTVIILANGASGTRKIARDSAAHRGFAAALEKVCHSLALQIVADGEGAQRVIEIEVRGAGTEAAARRIAETIATSPLENRLCRRRSELGTYPGGRRPRGREIRSGRNLY